MYINVTDLLSDFVKNGSKLKGTERKYQQYSFIYKLGKKLSITLCSEETF